MQGHGKNIIVGTAGHIDHGKTALVKALTGTDADRLAEEKRRGITIDLGFAHLDIAPDLRLGFIDVPGHERFVRNMLAGAAGIDLVLFVIAASESIRPQTREHFEICRMLGVKAGVIALTKADLVDPEVLELVRMETAELVAGSFLENAPQVAVSSTTGAGIGELRAQLEAAARKVREKEASGWFRLPVDRAFTMKGFGTVVTGTLLSGRLEREREVELYPTGQLLRVRGVHVYGEDTGRAQAGERTAVNLAKIEPSEISRGMVLSEVGRFRAVTVFDGRIDLLASAKPLKHRAPVHFHAGTAEIEAEVRWLDGRARLEPGGSAWARVVLREAALLLPGDRFIIRKFSPVVTIGGGVVTDISGHRYRRGEDAGARLAAMTPETLVLEAPFGMEEKELIAWTGIVAAPESAKLESAGKWLIARARVEQFRLKLAAECRAFHSANSLLPGMQKQDLKLAVMAGASPEVFAHVLAGAGELLQDGDIVRVRSHKVVLRQDEEKIRAAIEGVFERAGLAAPTLADVLKSCDGGTGRARSIFDILLREKRLIRVSPDLVLHASAIMQLNALLAKKRGMRFNVSAFKDWTGISRKYAIPLLEYLDRERVTRREGEERLVL